MNVVNKINNVDRKIETAVQTHVKAVGEWAGLTSKYNKALLLALSISPSLFLGARPYQLGAMVGVTSVLCGLDKFVKYIKQLEKDAGVENLTLAEGVLSDEDIQSLNPIKVQRLAHLTLPIGIALIEGLSSQNDEEFKRILLGCLNTSIIGFWLYILFAFHDGSDKGKKITDKIREVIKKLTQKSPVLQPAIAKK